MRKLSEIFMNKLRCLGFTASIVFIASMPAHADTGFSYEENTFIYYFSCLGIYPGSSLGLREKVWLFTMDQSPIDGKIVHVIQAAEAEQRFNALGFDKVYRDKPLWAEIGCTHPFRGDMPESLARVAPEPKNSGNLGIAVRGLPAGAWVSEGKGKSSAMDAKDNPYVGLVRPLFTDACYAADSLIRIKEFPIGKGHSIVQLDIGKGKKVGPEKRKQKIEEELKVVERVYAKWAWPEYKKKTLEKWERKDFLESVEICRFFLYGERVLKETRISRKTDVDERVDTAPDLNTDNWADTTDTAIGFISLNEGKDWDVLLVDVGWEGINYSVRQLNGPAVHYDRYLYTYH